MVGNFNLIRTPRIVFGKGRAEQITNLVNPGWKHILIITGSSSHEHNKSYSRFLNAINKTGIRINFEKIGNEPSPVDVDTIARNEKYNGIDAVIALGGGSVLDAGKAVSAMIPASGSVADYLEGVGNLKPSGEKKFFIAIPTTSGTGSEATSNAVITETGPEGFKRSLRHENYIPDVALVDPAMTLGCPADITASSGMDAFTQLLESYVSLKSGAITDSLALDGIYKIHKSLWNAVNDGSNIESRAGMSYAALLSGITLSNAGLGLIHGFASAAGGFFRVPHGTVCGTLMGVVNRYNIEALLKQSQLTVAHYKYARVGEILSEIGNKQTEWYMKFVADYIERMTEELHIKRL